MIDRAEPGKTDRLYAAPSNPGQAADFLRQIGDRSINGLPYEQMVSLASKVGVRVVDAEVRGVEQRGAIIRYKSKDPSRTDFYIWPMPTSAETLGPFIDFIHARVALENEKPAEERNEELLALGDVLTTTGTGSKIKQLYLDHIGVQITVQEKLLGPSELQKKITPLEAEFNQAHRSDWADSNDFDSVGGVPPQFSEFEQRMTQDTLYLKHSPCGTITSFFVGGVEPRHISKMIVSHIDSCSAKPATAEIK